MPHNDDASDFEIDLHGSRPDQALRRLAQDLYMARARGARLVLVITGRGWGNLEQKPILRGKVETWLATPDARKLGVQAWRVVSKGGALEVTLAELSGR